VLEARTMIADNLAGHRRGTFNLAFLGWRRAPRVTTRTPTTTISRLLPTPGCRAWRRCWCWRWPVSQALRILRDRRNEVVRAAAFAALMSITCMALHSLVDFNLQIPPTRSLSA
jgi:hypothetical protein